MEFKEIWEEPGGQRMFAVITNNNQRITITDEYYPTPEENTIQFFINERHRVLTIRKDEHGLLRILIETIRHGKSQIAKPYDFPISPALAAHMVERWGYKVRFETKGFHFRTGVDGCVRAIATSARTGRI